ncbi:MAG TPA: Hpt domain-containing protein [Candidatus Acidoferrales bacterium]
MSDEIVREFLVEGNENLDTLDRELVQLEKDPQNRATLASVFRTIHTIKGTCGFLGFTKLEAVAHVGENLLNRLRDLELLLNPDITTALLRMVDGVRQMMQSIEPIGNEEERNDEELIKMLTRVQQGGSLEEGPVAVPPRHASAAEGDGAANGKGKAKKDAKIVPVEAEKVTHLEERDAPPVQQSTRGGVSDRSIRVDVVLLDKLMNLVGELVLARKQVLQLSSVLKHAGFAGKFHPCLTARETLSPLASLLLSSKVPRKDKSDRGFVAAWV